MYKVVRNQSGVAICFGPNDEQYSPFVPKQCTLSIENSIPQLLMTDPDLDPLQKLKDFLVANPDIDLKKILGVNNG